MEKKIQLKKLSREKSREIQRVRFLLTWRHLAESDCETWAWAWLICWQLRVTRRAMVYSHPFARNRGRRILAIPLLIARIKKRRYMFLFKIIERKKKIRNIFIFFMGFEPTSSEISRTSSSEYSNKLHHIVSYLINILSRWKENRRFDLVTHRIKFGSINNRMIQLVQLLSASRCHFPFGSTSFFITSLALSTLQQRTRNEWEKWHFN
jgi:hypothetical protein